MLHPHQTICPHPKSIFRCAGYYSPTGPTPTMQTAQSDGPLFTMQPTRDILLWYDIDDLDDNTDDLGIFPT